MGLPNYFQDSEDVLENFLALDEINIGIKFYQYRMIIYLR